MPTRPIVPPYRGISNATPYYLTPGDMCPPNGMLNARCFVPVDDRPQIGKRPGLVKRFAARLGNGTQIQGMKAMTRASIITGYETGSCDVITDDWVGEESGALLGQVWLLRSNLAMYDSWYENVGASNTVYGDTATANPSTQDVSCITHTPDSSKLIFGSTYAITGRNVARVTCINPITGAIIWSHKIDPGYSTFVNTVSATNSYVFVTIGQFVRVLNATTGAQIGSDYNMNLWSSEAVDARPSADGDYLYVLFLGSTSAATLPSGQLVTTGKYAQHFRSGVMKFIIGSSGLLTQEFFGPGLLSTNAYYESAHGYLRFSEALSRNTDGSPIRANGVHPTALCTLPDGSIAVSHTNRGWGPNTGVPPTGYEGHTISLYDDTGALIWKADTNSLDDASGDGGLNDILYDGGGAIFSSVSAIAADALGNIYAGGRTVSFTPGGNACAFKLAGEDGSLVWATDLGMNASTQTVRQAAMAVAPDGSIWVAGDRNTAWTGAGGQAAHLWKLNPETGDILGWFDLNAASKSGLGVSVDINGQIAYCSTKV